VRRAGWTVRVEALEGGGARLCARDWLWAAWCAVPSALAGAPLLVWALLRGHAVEAGGALVVCALAAFTASLAWRHRRGLVLRRHGAPEELEVAGTEGAGWLGRPVADVVDGPWSVELVPFATPGGAPVLEDRGGDLVLRWPRGERRLARAVGPRWRHELEQARACLTRSLSG
jgi:hypothetical protein